MPKKKWIIAGAAYPVSCLALAVIPYLGPMFYTLHGGIGWVLLLFSFPWFFWWVLFSDIKKYSLGLRWRFAIVALVGYCCLTVPVAALLAFVLRKTIDNEITTSAVWQALNMPISIPFFIY